MSATSSLAPLLVRLRGTIDIQCATLPASTVSEALRAHTLANPEYAVALQRGNPRAHSMTKTVCSAAIEDGWLRLPVGSFALARRLLRGRDCEFVDERPRFASLGLHFGGQLLPFQDDALTAILKCNLGTLVAGCGVGKTEIGIAAIARRDVRTLVKVNTGDLAAQWIDRLRTRLGIEAGFIGDGRFDLREITVAMTQSLANEERLAQVAGAFEFLVVDEAHRHVTENSRRILSTLRTRFRLGLTATPERADGLSPFMIDHLGAVAHRVPLEEVKRAGRMVMPSYQQVATAFAYDYRDAEDWHPLQEALVDDEERNTLIVERAARDCRTVLGVILTGRVAHCEALAALLTARGLRARALTGAMPRAMRAAALDMARAGELDVIVATSLFDEGVDVARLARVYLAWPSKCEARFVQRVGRALRVYDGKGTPQIVDFVDARVGVLSNQARQRARIFAQNFGGHRLSEVA